MWTYTPEEALRRGTGAYRLDEIETASPAMRALVRMARRVVAVDSSLLIQGETGVGKEWLARAIHLEGTRAGAPFVAVNCAALPETLLESELFGHERGAFTGAVRERRGYFELAHRGTIFLDEVGEMAPSLQAKLLRVLQERTIQRLGGEREIGVDVRVMAATNRNLEEAMAARSFRPDLYYRLGVVTLTVPPLRERREDIPGLVRAYLDRFRAQFGRPDLELRADVSAALSAYSWPGNVRELVNVLERAVLLAGGDEIVLDDLPPAIARCAGTEPEPAAAGAPAAGEAGARAGRSLKEVREEAAGTAERAYLEELLRQTGGRIDETARRAGIHPRSLHARMKKLGLSKEPFRRHSGRD